jgi:hypothetical protein
MFDLEMLLEIILHCCVEGTLVTLETPFVLLLRMLFKVGVSFMRIEEEARASVK